MEQPAVESPHRRDRRVTETCRGAKDLLEHRGNVGRRAADDLQDLRRRSLLLEGFGQVAILSLKLPEQAHVLDRDRRLVGEGLEKIFLTLRRGARLCPRGHDDAERDAFAQHRNSQHSPPPALQAMRVVVLRIGEHVIDVSDGLRQDRPPGHSRHVRTQRILGLHGLQPLRGELVPGNVVQELAVVAEHGAVRAPAQCDGTAHDRVEHRLHIGRRAADDAQDLGRRGLPLEGLGELAVAGLQLVEEPRVLDRDDRLVGEGLEQADLLRRELADSAAADPDRADASSLPQHRREDDGFEAHDLAAAAGVHGDVHPALDVGAMDHAALQDRRSRSGVVAEGYGKVPPEFLPIWTLVGRQVHGAILADQTDSHV